MEKVVNVRNVPIIAAPAVLSGSISVALCGNLHEKIIILALKRKVFFLEVRNGRRLLSNLGFSDAQVGSQVLAMRRSYCLLERFSVEGCGIKVEILKEIIELSHYATPCRIISFAAAT